MATITASMVNELRSRTGQGMMECKKMLTETGGDIEKAIEAFRKKGVKASITERQASEGRVRTGVSTDGRTAAALAVNCNTDFTAKSEVVDKILQTGIEKLLANPSANLASDPDIQALLVSAAQQTGENVQLGRFEGIRAEGSGGVGAYIYAITGKIGVLMSFSKPVDEEFVKQLGGHIAFARPVGLTRESVPADLVAKERELAIESAKALGKPAQIAEKIAEGKIAAFFAERVLLDQPFFNTAVFEGKVSEFLKSKGTTLDRYVRVEVGN
jgi:elongation factor Ts